MAEGEGKTPAKLRQWFQALSFINVQQSSLTGIHSGGKLKTLANGTSKFFIYVLSFGT